jgi:hypothetical protein
LKDFFFNLCKPITGLLKSYIGARRHSLFHDNSVQALRANDPIIAETTISDALLDEKELPEFPYQIRVFRVFYMSRPGNGIFCGIAPTQLKTVGRANKAVAQNAR